MGGHRPGSDHEWAWSACQACGRVDCGSSTHIPCASGRLADQSSLPFPSAAPGRVPGSKDPSPAGGAGLQARCTSQGEGPCRRGAPKGSLVRWFAGRSSRGRCSLCPHSCLVPLKHTVPWPAPAPPWASRGPASVQENKGDSRDCREGSYCVPSLGPVSPSAHGISTPFARQWERSNQVAEPGSVAWREELGLDGQEGPV